MKNLKPVFESFGTNGFSGSDLTFALVNFPKAKSDKLNFLKKLLKKIKILLVR